MLAEVAVAVDDSDPMVEAEETDRLGRALGSGRPGVDGDDGCMGDGGDQGGVVAGTGADLQNPLPGRRSRASSIRAISVGAEDDDGGPPSCPMLVSSDRCE